MRHSWWGILLLVVIAGFIYLLDAVLMPFVTGMILAYLADPMANRFECWGMKRPLAVTSVFLVLSLILVVSLLIVVPLIIQQVKELGEVLPSILQWVEVTLAPQLQAWTGYDLQTEVANLREILVQNWRDAGGFLAQALEQVGRSSMALVSWVTYVALVPVVTFYLLLDWDRLINNIANLIPRQWVEDTYRLVARCDEVLSAFLRGQLLVMLCLGIIYALGLSLMGLNFGLLIGFISGIASIVPFLGFIVGMSIALVVALFQMGTVWAILGVIVVFSIGQVIESVVLQPKLLGDKIGLHPVAVIFSVLAGGELFGFIGVLLALPAAAVIMVLLREAFDRYKGSSLYDAEAVSESTASEQRKLNQDLYDDRGTP
ncbi:AI-2E family transporter [Halomonas llamarensis]|uniref:AI-2E family transporter n=1 Tax=Halomonas llamarensis TaxID=2945104 RepID=A0ABT0SNW1_9GAMM|nr:AI-2E family transporter [Halomonas llamarensis]MCL7929089.1 AI-2E family transporter [Halomonas llamarensis]